nr:MAG: hypothetical protein [Porcellio scaber clopovirus]
MDLETPYYFHNLKPYSVRPLEEKDKKKYDEVDVIIFPGIFTSPENLSNNNDEDTYDVEMENSTLNEIDTCDRNTYDVEMENPTLNKIDIYNIEMSGDTSYEGGGTVNEVTGECFHESRDLVCEKNTIPVGTENKVTGVSFRKSGNLEHKKNNLTEGTEKEVSGESYSESRDLGCEKNYLTKGTEKDVTRESFREDQDLVREKNLSTEGTQKEISEESSCESRDLVHEKNSVAEGTKNKVNEENFRECRDLVYEKNYTIEKKTSSKRNKKRVTHEVQSQLRTQKSLNGRDVNEGVKKSRDSNAFGENYEKLRNNKIVNKMKKRLKKHSFEISFLKREMIYLTNLINKQNIIIAKMNQVNKHVTRRGRIQNHKD